MKWKFSSSAKLASRITFSQSNLVCRRLCVGSRIRKWWDVSWLFRGHSMSAGGELVTYPGPLLVLTLFRAVRILLLCIHQSHCTTLSAIVILHHTESEAAVSMDTLRSTRGSFSRTSTAVPHSAFKKSLKYDLYIQCTILYSIYILYVLAHIPQYIYNIVTLPNLFELKLTAIIL